MGLFVVYVLFGHLYEPDRCLDKTQAQLGQLLHTLCNKNISLITPFFLQNIVLMLITHHPQCGSPKPYLCTFIS